jgi:hypothetical protein
MITHRFTPGDEDEVTSIDETGRPLFDLGQAGTTQEARKLSCLLSSHGETGKTDKVHPFFFKKKRASALGDHSRPIAAPRTTDAHPAYLSSPRSPHPHPYPHSHARLNPSTCGTGDVGDGVHPLRRAPGAPCGSAAGGGRGFVPDVGAGEAGEGGGGGGGREGEEEGGERDHQTEADLAGAQGVRRRRGGVSQDRGH